MAVQNSSQGLLEEESVTYLIGKNLYVNNENSKLILFGKKFFHPMNDNSKTVTDVQR
jgi:hypothetical protein